MLGAQQNRTFDVSALVPAGERILVPVSCVEQGRWDHTRHREAFRPSPQAADPSLRRTKRAAANAAGRVNQNEVWAEVSGRLAAHGVYSHSEALSDLYDSRRADLDPLGRAIRHVDGQIGALACVSGQPVALDLVSRAEVFAALLPALAQGYALDALGGTEPEPDPRQAEYFLRSALAPAAARAAHGRPRPCRRARDGGADRRGTRARGRADPARRLPGRRRRPPAGPPRRPPLTSAALIGADRLDSRPRPHAAAIESHRAAPVHPSALELALIRAARAA